MPLTDRDRALLDFESRWSGHGAAKEEAIRRELALTPARYYQLLERTIDAPDAAAYDALLVHRLRRLRDASMSSARRAAATLGVRSGAAG
ncbi:MAG: DUF3263 domain-containing protein [Microbacterium sp.]|nr:MAG: DUF3263 domain-containing protein [Microbacterium sp.]